MKTAAEYRAMAEECFKWAREAHSAEVRLSLLKLAQVWLDIAAKLDGLPPTRTDQPQTPHRERRGLLGPGSGIQ